MTTAERFDVAYLVLSGTTTAARGPELLRGLVALGFATVIALPTPNASRVVAGRELADVEGARVVESYFDLAIRPRPPRGVVLFAPCSFNSLNKLAHGIADSLALSVVAEAIGRRTPVIVAPSLNQPLLEHPQAQASLRMLPTWGVTIVPPVDTGEGPRLAPSEQVLDSGASPCAVDGPELSGALACGRRRGRAGCSGTSGGTRMSHRPAGSLSSGDAAV